MYRLLVKEKAGENRARKKSPLLLLALLPLTLAFWNCASAPQKSTDPTTASQDLPIDLEEAQKTPIAHEFFVRGRHQDVMGNHKVALDFYKIALQYDSKSRELCFFISNKYKELGDYQEALKYGLRGIQLPGEADLEENKLIGDIYLRLGNLAKSIEYFKKAHINDESDRNVLYTLITIYEQEGSISEQSEVLEKLLPLVDYPERLVEKLAKLYKTLGKYDSLVTLFDRAWRETGQSIFGEKLAAIYESMELFHNFLDVYKDLYKEDRENIYYKVQIARAFLTLEENDSAFHYYRSLVEEYPEKEQFVYTFATLLYIKQEYAEAKSYFIKLLELYPENSTYHYYLGSTAEMLGDNSLAKIEYYKAVNMNKNILEYWAKLGIFLLKEESFAEGIKLFEEMVTYHATSAYAWYLLGIANNRAADFFEKEMQNLQADDSLVTQKGHQFRNEAIGKFKKSLEINKEDPKVLFELGVSYERVGKISESISTFKNLIKIDTTSAAALNYLGYMLVELDKDLSDAIRYIDRALEIEPDNGAYLDSKGWWFYKKKDYAKARQFIEKALETGTQDITILEHLALILEKLGETDSAMEQWSLILKMDPYHKLANLRLN